MFSTQAKPQIEDVIKKAANMDYILESQNVIIKDLFDNVTYNCKQLADFESIDLDDRFNSMTRKMIAEVCRE